MCRRKKHFLCFCLTVALMLGSCLSPWLFGLGPPDFPWRHVRRSLVFLDVNQGDCIHISSGGFNALVDGGGSRYSDVGAKILKPYLLKNGISRIDLAVVTHDDSDHALGIKQLSQVFPIKTIAFPFVYEGNEEIREGYRAENFIFLKAGDRLLMGDAVFEVLSPGEAALSESDNGNSLVGLLETEGVRVLLTGDITGERELELLNDKALSAKIRADILKIAHHGSAYSTEEAFLSACNPAAALISCGRGNAYGHPSGRVLDLLDSSDIIIMRTDIWGAVALKNASVGFVIFENAAGSRKWHIPLKQKRIHSILSEP